MKKLSTIALVALVALPLLAAGEPPPAAEDANVLYTLTIADTEPDGATSRRSARVLGLSGTWAKLSTGWKVAIPTTTQHAGAGEPATSFRYQNVGLSASLEGRLAGDGRVRVRGRVEISAVEPLAAPARGGSSPPRVANFNHDFNVLVRDRSSAVLAEVPRPEGGTMTLTLSAAIEN